MKNAVRGEKGKARANEDEEGRRKKENERLGSRDKDILKQEL